MIFEDHTKHLNGKATRGFGFYENGKMSYVPFPDYIGATASDFRQTQVYAEQFKDNIDQHARSLCRGREKIGLLAWCTFFDVEAGKVRIDILSYEECIAVAGLVMNGADPRMAAMMASHGIVLPVGPDGVQIDENSGGTAQDFEQLGGVRLNNDEVWGLFSTPRKVTEEDLQYVAAYSVASVTAKGAVRLDLQRLGEFIHIDEEPTQRAEAN